MEVSDEKRIHYLVLPNNPSDAFNAIRDFAASLEEPNEDGRFEGDDEE